MSLHTQLLRGLLALPVLLLLAVASVTAPAQPPHARAESVARAHAMVAVGAEGNMAIVAGAHDDGQP